MMTRAPSYPVTGCGRRRAGGLLRPLRDAHAGRVCDMLDPATGLASAVIGVINDDSTGPQWISVPAVGVTARFAKIGHAALAAPARSLSPEAPPDPFDRVGDFVEDDAEVSGNLATGFSRAGFGWGWAGRSAPWGWGWKGCGDSTCPVGRG